MFARVDIKLFQSPKGLPFDGRTRQLSGTVNPRIRWFLLSKLGKGSDEEVLVPADLLESLADLKFFHRRDRDWPLFDISRQWVSRSMKEAAAAGIGSARAHLHVLRHTYGQNAVLRGVPTPALKSWLGHLSLAKTERYVQLAGGHHSWVERP